MLKLRIESTLVLEDEVQKGRETRFAVGDKVEVTILEEKLKQKTGVVGGNFYSAEGIISKIDSDMLVLDEVNILHIPYYTGLMLKINYANLLVIGKKEDKLDKYYDNDRRVRGLGSFSFNTDEPKPSLHAAKILENSDEAYQLTTCVMPDNRPIWLDTITDCYFTMDEDGQKWYKVTAHIDELPKEEYIDTYGNKVYKTEGGKLYILDAKGDMWVASGDTVENDDSSNMEISKPESGAAFLKAEVNEEEEIVAEKEVDKIIRESDDNIEDDGTMFESTDKVEMDSDSDGEEKIQKAYDKDLAPEPLGKTLEEKLDEESEGIQILTESEWKVAENKEN